MSEDVKLGSTVDFKFTTRQFSTGAPFALAGTPAVSAYVNNSTTQITAGITLTADFDSVTGLNHVRAVLSTANGYALGDQIDFVLTAGTVDSVSVVGEVIGRFTIEARSPFDHDRANHDTADTFGEVVTADGIVAAMFNTDSGETYATAVAGSPVKEIADNAGGSSLTEAGIATAVRTELTTELAHIDADVSSRATSDQATAIEADTQDIQARIPAALSTNGNMKSDILELNDTPVVGTGASGDKWRA